MLLVNQRGGTYGLKAISTPCNLHDEVDRIFISKHKCRCCHKQLELPCLYTWFQGKAGWTMTLSNDFHSHCVHNVALVVHSFTKKKLHYFHSLPSSLILSSHHCWNSRQKQCATLHLTLQFVITWCKFTWWCNTQGNEFEWYIIPHCYQVINILYKKH